MYWLIEDKLNENASAICRISRWLASQVSSDASVCVGEIEQCLPFDPVEEAAVVGCVPKRQYEFRTGRRLARNALSQLGGAQIPIPVGKNREPIWPPGFIGTISHTDTLCLALAGRSARYLGLGADLEPMKRLDASLLSHIANPVEISAMTAGAGGCIDPGLVCFSAKEAFYKAYFQVTKTVLDFTDAVFYVSWSAQTFAVELSSQFSPIAGRSRFEGRFAIICGHVVTYLAIEAT